MNILIVLLAILPCVIPLVQLVKNHREQRYLAAAIWFCPSLKVLWVGLAVCLSWARGWYYESELALAQEEILEVLIRENVYMMLVYYILHRNRWRFDVVGIKNAFSDNASRKLLLFGLTALITLAITISYSGSENADGGPQPLGRMQQVRGMLDSLYFGFSLLCGALLIVDYRAPGLWRLLGAASLLLLALWRLSIGLRGSLVLMALLLAFASIAFRGRLQGLLAFLTLGLLTLPFFEFLGTNLREFNRQLNKQAENTGRLNSNIIELARAERTIPMTSVNLMLDALNYRLQDVRNSVALIRQREIGAGAGIMPVIGSAAVYVPRFIWPNKPMQNSMDADTTGQGRYIVMRELYNEPTSYGPILASSHAYWEFGFIGVILFGIVNGYIVVFIATFAVRASSAVQACIPLIMLGINEYYPAIDRPISFFLRDFMLSVVPLLILQSIIRTIFGGTDNR